MYNVCTCVVGPLFGTHYFGSVEEDAEHDFNHMLIDDSSAQGGDKAN